MPSRSIFVSGNDGSGKSTFTRKLRSRLEARGASVAERRYYGSVVRRALRGVIERLTQASRRKLDGGQSGNAAPEARSADAVRGRSLRSLAVLGFLWTYQTAMGVEARLRDWVSRYDVEIVDRSFIDDLASIAETLKVEPPPALLRYSCALFPVRRLYFLSAGHEIEYARIVEMDSSADFHRAKGERYDALVAACEPALPTLRRISTRGRAHTRGDAA